MAKPSNIVQHINNYCTLKEKESMDKWQKLDNKYVKKELIKHEIEEHIKQGLQCWDKIISTQQSSNKKFRTSKQTKVCSPGGVRER